MSQVAVEAPTIRACLNAVSKLSIVCRALWYLERMDFVAQFSPICFDSFCNLKSATSNSASTIGYYVRSIMCFIFLWSRNESVFRIKWGPFTKSLIHFSNHWIHSAVVQSLEFCFYGILSLTRHFFHQVIVNFLLSRASLLWGYGFRQCIGSNRSFLAHLCFLHTLFCTGHNAQTCPKVSVLTLYLVDPIMRALLAQDLQWLRLATH